MPDGEGARDAGHDPGAAAPAAAMPVPVDELVHRASRPPDHAAENAALVRLLDALASAPESILEVLADTALQVCGAGSAGVSLLDASGDGGATFRWAAVAGRYREHAGRVQPRHESFSGVVVDRDAPLLVRRPPPPASGPPLEPPVEVLLAPFRLDDRPAGTLWVALHEEQGGFDREDARLLERLARFASAALRTHRSVLALRDSEARALRSSERFLLAAEAVHGHVYDVDVRAGRVWRSHGVHALTGYGPAEVGDGADWWRARVHPDDWARADAEGRARIAAGASRYETDYRIVRADGTVRWVLDRTRVLRDADGTLARLVGSVVDITALREANAQLQATERRFATLADTVPVLVWITDAGGANQFVNRGWCEYTGQSAAEAAGNGWLAVVHPEDLAATRERWQAALRAGGPYELDYRLRRRDGAYRWFHGTGAPQRDPGGAVLGWFGTCTDIDEPRRAFEALQDSERRFRTVVDASPVSLTLLQAVRDADGRVVDYEWAYLNRIALAAIGHTTEELFGRRVSETAVGSSWRVPELYAALERAVETGERQTLEVRGARLGDPRSYLAIVAPFGDGALVWLVDVTELKRAEIAVRASEQRFVTLANSVPAIVWSSRDGTIDYLNRLWYEYTGLPPDAPLPEVMAGVVHPDDLPRVRALWDVAERDGTPAEFTYRLRRRDGAWRWFIGRVVPERDADGRVLTWFGTASDVDDAKRTEEVLREQEHALREADRRKDEFLATLAHELRNPLAPIRNAAKLLRAPGTDAKARDWAATIVDRQVQTMALLLDDLLDVSRITRGKLTLQRQRVDLGSIVEAALETTRPTIDARRQALTVVLPEGPVELDADPLRASQVLSNLLTNAAKYTDAQGRIALVATVEGDAVRIAVRDTGIGLAPESLASIFGMFSQVKSALDRSEGGLGIGLALVKGLVELHGGRVEAKSPGLGRGSEFAVTLPLAAPAGRDAAGAAARAGRPPVARRRVLIADDNEDGGRSLALLLELAGHEVHLAHDGREACELAERVRPEVAFLDIGMPELNGYEVARRLRASDWTRGATLVALTGWGQDDDKRRAAAAGFDAHLTKPVDYDVVETLLAAPR